MRRPGRRAAWAAAGAAAGLLAISAPPPALGQAGFYAEPSLAVSGLYDDNVFSTPSNAPPPAPGTAARPERKDDDFLARTTPRMSLGYRSDPYTLTGFYSVDAEAYAKHSDRNRVPSSQNAGLVGRDVRFRPLFLSFDSGYTESQRGRDLNAPEATAASGGASTGLDERRGRARAYHLNPEASYALSPVTNVNGAYQYAHTTQIGRPGLDRHTAGGALTHSLTPRDDVDLGYWFNRYDFDVPTSFLVPVEPGAPPPPAAVAGTVRLRESTHTATLGWRRRLTPLLVGELRGGPRIHDDGSVEAEALASLGRTFERGQATLLYTRTQATSVGDAGLVATESFGGWASYTPLRSWSVTAVLALYRNSQGGRDADVYRAAASTAYDLSRWLTLVGSYEFSHQDGVLGSSPEARSRGDRIDHHVVLVGFRVSDTYRVY